VRVVRGVGDREASRAAPEVLLVQLSASLVGAGTSGTSRACCSPRGRSDGGRLPRRRPGLGRAPRATGARDPHRAARRRTADVRSRQRVQSCGGSSASASYRDVEVSHPSFLVTSRLPRSSVVRPQPSMLGGNVTFTRPDVVAASPWTTRSRTPRLPPNSHHASTGCRPLDAFDRLGGA